MEHFWNDSWQKKMEVSGERPAVLPLLSTTNPTWTALRLNPELRSEKLTTNGQSSI
jgi:hypothetical protein